MKTSIIYRVDEWDGLEGYTLYYAVQPPLSPYPRRVTNIQVVDMSRPNRQKRSCKKTKSISLLEMWMQDIERQMGIE